MNGSESSPAAETLYRILPAADWTAAAAAGVYAGGPHDHADGFLHLSTAAQVAGTLAAHYPGQVGLVLVAIDPAGLPTPPRWEPSRAGALFPHLYAPLPTAAVRAVWPLAVDGAGRHILPGEVNG